MGGSNFGEFIMVAATNKKIRRAGWEDKDNHVCLVDGKLMIKGGDVKDGLYHPWIISVDDLYGDDWEVA